MQERVQLSSYVYALTTTSTSSWCDLMIRIQGGAFTRKGTWCIMRTYTYTCTFPCKYYYVFTKHQKKCKHFIKLTVICIMIYTSPYCYIRSNFLYVWIPCFALGDALCVYTGKVHRGGKYVKRIEIVHSISL